MSQPLIAIVMAAGKGARFKSRTPKLLHTVHGRTMIERVLESVEAIAPQRLLVIVGHGNNAVRAVIPHPHVTFVTQEPQLGTGHAVQVALQHVSEKSGTVLVLNGDIPLIRSTLLEELLRQHGQQQAATTLVSTLLENPDGYGRILRDRRKRLVGIVEERDASASERRIHEINVGLYAFSLPVLKQFIPRLNKQNAQKEYYLTDLVGILRKARKKMSVFCAPDPMEVLGVNDRVELAHISQILRVRKLEVLMRSGVTVLDPPTTSVDDTATVGPDTVLYPGVRVEGPSRIGSRCVIRSYSRITDSILDDDVTVNDMSVINESHVAQKAAIGPFAHLRMNARVESEARVGNFVELKKTTLGRGSKAAHLTYLGDTTVGKNANIGAGTITCNYDGVHKNLTLIEDECFIGSGVELVAPVAVHKGAYVAAGSVITEDVPAGSLAIARERQTNKTDWKLKRNQKKAKAS